VISSKRIMISKELEAQWIAAEELWWSSRYAKSFGKSFRQPLSLFSLEFRTDGRNTALEEFGDGYECCHQMGKFRVECSVAARTSVLVYVSLRLSESE
jgi:hypothetical protein